MNTLIVIGYLSNRICYINVPRDEAIDRFIEEEDYNEWTKEEIEKEGIINEYKFKDKFYAYDAFNT